MIVCLILLEGGAWGGWGSSVAFVSLDPELLCVWGGGGKCSNKRFLSLPLVLPQAEPLHKKGEKHIH